MAVIEEDQVRARIRDLVANLSPAEAPEIMPDSRLVNDLEYQSLALLELAFALEEEYDLPPIDEAIASQIVMVSDIEEYVLSQLKERQTPA
jgi:acyl carrier protein